MNDRNKILSQIVIVANLYDLEIININFTNINELKDVVDFTFKDEDDKFKFKISYSYEKDDLYKINGFIYYFKNEFDKILKEDK